VDPANACHGGRLALTLPGFSADGFRFHFGLPHVEKEAFATTGGLGVLDCDVNRASQSQTPD